MRHEIVKSDITVIGGGLAGVCAAVAAARLGKTVSLIQNRSVLGGNSSSEVRVWVCGATAHGVNRYARETGIMGEMFVENQYRNIDGNPYIWDLVVLETVKAEPNIQLFLNTDVHEVEAEGDRNNRSILSVTGWMMGAEKRIRFESQQFLDCTGDGLIGFLAGAEYRIGREAQSEFNEAWAPLVADNITLGSTLLFYTKDAGRPVKFVPPSFGKDIEQTTIPVKRVIRSGDNGCAYWWIEWGGELDTVHDNEKIRDELWAVIYGIWDYIKNSGKFDAEHMTLEWVGSVPGKREYRRFVGDYILNQNDIVAQRDFEDRVAFGGWSIDLHPPQGMYSTESGSKHFHADGIYHIPYRSLYSVNISNMLMAGRNISATHVAFGTTRVMATCAVMGEAAGTAAALSIEKGVSPRELHREYMHELKQTLLRQDASVIGIRNEDENDLARSAKLSASSTLQRIALDKPLGSSFVMDADIGLIVPVDLELDGVELLVDATEDTIVELELWDTGREENYVPYKQQTSATAEITKGVAQWVQLNLSWKPDKACNAFIIIKANDKLALYASSVPQFGVLVFRKDKSPVVSADLENREPEQPIIEWRMNQSVRRPICFRISSSTQAFAPAKVTDGYKRPYGGPHLWSSEAITEGTIEWLELSWQEPKSIHTVHLIFNDDVNEDLINLHHHRTEFEIIPELVKKYCVQAYSDGEWFTLAEVDNNRKRKAVHQLDQSITTERLRILVESTNGSNYAEIVEVRVY